MSSDIHSKRNFHQRIIGNADQTEFEAIRLGSVVIEAGLHDESIAEAFDDYDPSLPQLERWQSRDLKVDTATGDVRNVLVERSTRLKGAYPFRVEDGRLTYEPTVTKFYEFCLLICLAKDLTKGEHTRLPRSFERISAVLVRLYLGKFARSIHVGFPRDPAVGTTFQQAMSSVNVKTGEWIWAPEEGMPAASTIGGDEGVDFVVWTDALDERRGHLFVLGQCACGNDWINKFNDLDLHRLRKWMHPLSYVDPVRSFATPFQMSNGHLRDAQRLAGLVFDRNRLTLLAREGLNDSEYSGWEKQLPALCSLVMPQLDGPQIAKPRSRATKKGL